MSWRREDREYDKMQEGFYVTGIERRIKKLEAENARMREALTELAAPVIRPEIYNSFGTIEAAINSFANAVKSIARDALEGTE